MKHAIIHTMEEKVLYEKKKITGILILLVILSFLHFLTRGNYTLKFGNSYYDIINQGEIYRVLTSVFLHGSVTHLLSNCLSLFIIGLAYTRKNSLIKFYLIFVFGGVIASFGRVFYHGLIRKEPFTYSLGASGGIFAVLGALVFFSLIKERGRDRIGALIYAVIVFLLGTETPNTDNAAHFVGLLAGITIEAIILFVRYLKKNTKDTTYGNL